MPGALVPRIGLGAPGLDGGALQPCGAVWQSPVPGLASTWHGAD